MGTLAIDLFTDNSLIALHCQHKLNCKDIGRLLGIIPAKIGQRLKSLHCLRTSLSRSTYSKQTYGGRVSLDRFAEVYAENTMTREQMAAYFGVSKTTIGHMTTRIIRTGMAQRRTKSKSDPLTDAELTNLYYEQGFSLEYIVTTFRGGRKALKERLKKLGNYRSLESRRLKWDSKNTPDLIKDYLQNQISMREIADKYGITLYHLQSLLRKLKYNRKRLKKVTFTPKQIIEIKNLYLRQQFGTPYIAKQYSVSEPTIRRLLRAQKVKIRKFTKSPACVATNILPSNDMFNARLVSMYSQEKIGATEIAKLYHCHRSTIMSRLRQLRVRIRSNREAMLAAKARARDKGKAYLADNIDLYKLVEDYVVRGKTIKQSAICAGTSYSVARRRLLDLGVIRGRKELNEMQKQRFRKKVPPEQAKVGKEKPKTETRPLTEKQKKLIEEYYTDIRRLINTKFHNNKIARWLRQNRGTDLEELVDIVAGFAPEATQKYDPSFKVPFPVYVATKCVWLYLDHLRCESSFGRLSDQRSKEVSEICDEIVSEQGRFRDEDIWDKLKQRGYKDDLAKKYLDAYRSSETHFGAMEYEADKNFKTGHDHLVYFDRLQDVITDFRSASENAAWRDAKQYILSKVLTLRLSSRRWNPIARAVVVENILPQIEDKPPTPLRVIGDRYKMSESRVSQIKTMTLQSKAFRTIVAEAIGNPMVLEKP